MSLCGAAFATEQRFPPPEFTETHHQVPHEQYPAPSAAAIQYLDVAVLFVALCLATFLALKLRSRNAVFALMVACLVYFGFWRKGCVCPIGAIQNVTLALADPGYTVPLVVLAYFLLPLAFTVLFGRSFCAAVCPLGAIQDAVVVRPVHVPHWLAAGLRVLAYAYLGGAVIFAAGAPAFLICRYDPFVGFFRVSGSLGMLLFGGVVLAVGLFVGRPYCRFLCPYGVLLQWMSRLSRRHLTITPSECTQCRLCEDSCPFDAILKPAPAREPESRRAGIRRLGWLLVLLPFLVAAGAGAGILAHAPLSRIHPTVRLAERVVLEKSGRLPDTTLESRTFYETDKPAEALLGQARAIRRQFRTGSILLGAFLGLVVGCRLLALSVRRKRTDYQPDRGGCFSCGRCIPYCPVEKKPESLETRDERAG